MTLTQVTRDHVLAAVAEYKALGPAGFHERYGYGDPVRYYLRYEGDDYPAKGIMGAAHIIGLGEPLASYGGGTVSNSVLEKLGFEIVDLPKGAPAKKICLICS
jgi:hypothetical protein